MKVILNTLWTLFCGCTLKDGTNLIAILYLVLSIFAIIVTGAKLHVFYQGSNGTLSNHCNCNESTGYTGYINESCANTTNAVDDGFLWWHKCDAMAVIYIEVLIMAVITLFANICLLLGTIQRKCIYLLPWLFWHCIKVLIIFTSGILVAVTSNVEIKSEEGVATIIVLYLIAALSIICIFIVCKYYRQVKKISCEVGPD